MFISVHDIERVKSTKLALTLLDPCIVLLETQPNNVISLSNETEKEVSTVKYVINNFIISIDSYKSLCTYNGIGWQTEADQYILTKLCCSMRFPFIVL